MIVKLLSLLAALMSLSQTALDAYAAQTNLGGSLYLVNRSYTLSEDYVPPDLVQPLCAGAESGTLMRKEAAASLEELFASAKEAGYTLVAVSGYRSWGTQRTIYSRRTGSGDKKEKERARLLVAPPGASEHQLGLAMDLGRKGKTNLNAAFGSSEEGAWVREHAHEFGFIIRYKADWSDITGYADEPWHIRYVGRDHAGRIHELDIPLEHYIEQLRLAYFGEYITEDSLR